MTTAAPSRRFVPVDLDPSDLARVEPIYRELLDRSIISAAELERWLIDLSELASAVDEAATRAHNDHSCHTDDAEIEKRYMHFVRTVQPALEPIVFELQKKFANSPHRASLPAGKLGLLGRRWETDIKLFREANIPLQTRATELATEYGKTCGQMIVEFRGKSLTLQQLARYQEETDRATREEAWRLAAERRLKDREAIEKIFDAQLEVRGNIARNAGLPSYRDYVWRSMKRFDYTPAQCVEFADTIASEFVPLVAELDRRRRAALKVDSLRPWDLAVDVEGRAPLRPFAEDRIDVFVGATKRVLDHVSPDLAAQFAALRMGENLDLESRKGKRPGGYQSSLEESKQPFIFMNAAGTQGDVDTLLHEAGHAFHYLAACGEPVLELRQAPLEFCEVASMSMELFGGDFLDEFYGAGSPEAARARKQHLEGIIRFFPWMATIDMFQHWLYTNLGHSREQRGRAWLATVNRFGSDEVDWFGLERERAAMWQRQLHLFNYPFYYVEYGIAQIGALQLWVKWRRDRAAAVAGYRNALALGGTKPLPELFSAAGIRFDFSRATIRPLIEALQAELD